MVKWAVEEDRPLAQQTANDHSHPVTFPGIFIAHKTLLFWIQWEFSHIFKYDSNFIVLHGK